MDVLLLVNQSKNQGGWGGIPAFQTCVFVSKAVGHACFRLFLHCAKLRLFDFTGSTFTAEAPLPAALRDFLEALEEKAAEKAVGKDLCKEPQREVKKARFFNVRLETMFATRNKCIASSNKCLTSSNKKL